MKKVCIENESRLKWNCMYLVVLEFRVELYRL